MVCRSHNRVGYYWVAVSLLAFSLSGTGCGDWPQFDYGSSPTIEVEEIESEGNEEVQNLSKLRGDALIFGNIETSSYGPVPEGQEPFGFSWWYWGDIDWYGFYLEDPRNLSLSLGWELDNNPVIDLYFFVASAETGDLTLIDMDADAVGEQRSLEIPSLAKDTIYVVAAAGREGDDIDYNLLLHFSR